MKSTPNLFSSNLGFLREKFPQLFCILADASFDQPNQGEFACKEILAGVSKGLSHCIRVPRILSGSKYASLSYEELADKILDKHDASLVASLPIVNAKSRAFKKEVSTPLRDLTLIGASSLFNLYRWSDSRARLVIDSDKLQHKASILLVESSPEGFSEALAYLDLQELFAYLADRSIGLQLVYSDDVNELTEQVFAYFASTLPCAIYGCYVFLRPYAPSALASVYAYLSDSVAFARRILGSYGTSSDELNQLLQAVHTACSLPKISMIQASENFSQGSTVVIVGGGPSLDASISHLQNLCSQGVSIVAAGSSLRSLLINGIRPCAAVLLERGSSVYESCSKLIEEGFDLSKISLISSITADPRLAKLFKRTFFFHRPLSVAKKFFVPFAQAETIPFSGPEAVNAAIEVLVKVGFKSFVLFGCDFASSTRTTYRASGCMGHSPRDMVMPRKSNRGSTIYSDQALISSWMSLDRLIAYASDIRIYRFGLGLPLSQATIDVADYAEAPLAGLRFLQHLEFDPYLDNVTISLSLSSSSYASRVQKVCGALEELPRNLEAHFRVITSDHWSIKIHRIMADILADEPICSNDFNPDAIARHLMRQLIVSLFPYLYDETSSESFSATLSETIKSLHWAANFYIAVLRSWLVVWEDGRACNRMSWDPGLLASSLRNDEFTEV
jgi:hypothetical protein